MKRLLVILTFCLFAVLPVEAQQVSDTLQVTVVGTLTEVVLSAADLGTPQAGDSILLMATALDEDGATINAMFSFFTEDSTVVRLEPRAQPNEALGIAIRKGTVKIWVVAEPITEVLIASFRDDELNWSGYDTIPVGQNLQYCAYAVRAGRLVAESPGPPTCPIVFTAEPIPALPQVFAINRRVGRSAFNALGRGMRVYRGEGQETVRYPTPR